VQAWRGAGAAARAVAAGQATIASPTEHCYFDYDVAITDLRAAYAFCPSLFAAAAEGANSGVSRGSIIGGEFNLWTEYLETTAAVDEAAWPRGLATAEVLWAGGGGICFGHGKTEERWEPFGSFYQRAKMQYSLLKSLGAKVGRAFPPCWSDDGDPPSSDAIRSAVPGSSIKTTLPVHSWHHVEFAADGYPETYFQSDRAVRAGDTIELFFGPEPLKGCIVVRARSGRFERNALRSGILEVRLSPAGAAAAQLSGDYSCFSNQVG
jgi:hypothetical protein